MTSSELENLVKLGSISREAPLDAELRGLVDTGSARLSDARRPSLALASRFDVAYNASHALSLAALRLSGYRSSSRYQVFQCLPHTLGVAAGVWRVLTKGHQLRNQGEYEGFLDVDDRLVEDLIEAAAVVEHELVRKLGDRL